MPDTLILIAEDSPEIRRFLEEAVLRPAGYQVRSVGDGLSALTLARELQPDLVITDQHMPSLTGIELIRKLRSDPPTIPAILITSEGSEALAVEAMRAGALDYLTKPFEAEHMLAAVGRALAEGRRWQALVVAQTDSQEGARRLERRLKELETLALIGRTVTVMLDLDKVLTTVVEAAVRLTEAEEGSLLLLDDGGELTMRASKNFDEEFARTFRLRTDDSLAGSVIASGEPVFLDESAPQKIKTSYLVHSLIYVPLRVRGHTIGVLGVDNRKAGRTLTREDVTVMLAMADYAAIAIENARLYTRSEEARSKLETVLSQTENGVIVVDPDHRLLLINRAAQDAFGVDGDLLGRSVAEAFDDPRLLALIREPGRQARREEIELADGRTLNAQRTAIQGVGEAIILQDITHLKELDRIKSEFVTTVSHDLRSPLTAILGYSQLIGRAGSLNEQQQEFVRRVQLSVEEITELVTDLLDLGKIEAGLDNARERTPVGVLARYSVEGLRGAAEARGLKLDLTMPEDLPMVMGSPIRLRQMIANLIENAIKYTPAGGHVRVEGEADADQVILHVRDDGPGIPPADQPYLFDKFYRASNVPDETPGTGLGLSIVKSIVDNHGGRIWVESKLGGGTTFTVVLPAPAS
ncbi:MAG: ATP-binding protein [Anaerolineales bacterium]